MPTTSEETIAGRTAYLTGELISSIQDPSKLTNEERASMMAELTSLNADSTAAANDERTQRADDTDTLINTIDRDTAAPQTSASLHGVRNMMRHTHQLIANKEAVVTWTKMPPLYSATPSAPGQGTIPVLQCKQGTNPMAVIHNSDGTEDTRSGAVGVNYNIQPLIKVPAEVLSAVSETEMEVSYGEGGAPITRNVAKVDFGRILNAVTTGLTDFPAGLIQEPQAQMLEGDWPGAMFDPSCYRQRLTPGNMKDIEYSQVKTESTSGSPASEGAAPADTDPGFGKVKIGAIELMTNMSITRHAEYDDFLMELQDVVLDQGMHEHELERNRRALTGAGTAGNSTDLVHGLLTAVDAVAGMPDIEFTAAAFDDDFTNINAIHLLRALGKLNEGKHRGNMTHYLFNLEMAISIHAAQYDRQSPGYPVISMAGADLGRGNVGTGWMRPIRSHPAMPLTTSTDSTVGLFINGKDVVIRSLPIQVEMNPFTYAQSRRVFVGLWSAQQGAIVSPQVARNYSAVRFHSDA